MKRKATILFISILFATIIFCNLSNEHSEVYASIDHSLNNLCEQMTQTDNPADVSLIDYTNDYIYAKNNKSSDIFTVLAKREITPGDYFQNGCTFIGTYGYDFTVNIFADDNITKFIPRELFTYDVEKIYIGKGYGFYIKTFTLGSSVIYANVALFDVEKAGSDNGENDFEVSIKIKCLLKMDYCYVARSDEKIRTKSDEEEYSTAGFGSVVFAENINDAVIPMPRNYSKNGSIVGETHYIFKYMDSEEFRVKDVSLGASTYNVNSPNYGEEEYSVYDDYGYFFIGSEYEYSATKLTSGDPLRGVHKIGTSALSAALGGIDKIGTALSVIDTTISISQGLQTIVGGVSYNETNENYVFPNSHLYNTRQTQIDNYGKLIKTSAIAINTNGDDRLYFMQDDYAKGTFLISHTDRANGSKAYSRLDACFGLKVVRKNVETAFISNTVSYDLSAPETHEMKAIGQTGYYMLPMTQMNFSFVPQYNGTYTFDIGTSGIDLYINDTKRTLDSNKYTIDMLAGNTYSVSLRNTTDNKRVGEIDVDCSDFIGEKTLAGNEARLFKFVDDSEKICLLTTNNENVKFSSQFDADFNLLVGFLNTYEYSTRVTDGKTYFLVTNSANTQQTFVGEKKTEEQLSSGGSIDLSANEHNAIYKYTSSIAGDYVFTLTYGVEGDKIGARFIDEVGNNLPHSVIVENAYRQYIVTLGENQTIMVLLFKDPETSSDVSERIDISIMDPTVWYADGVELPSTIVDVRRGQRVRLEMKVAEEKRVLLGSVSADQFGDICYASGGYIYVRSTARIGIVNLALVRHFTRYDESGETSQADIISYIRLNVILEDITNEIGTFNDNSGIGLSITNGKVDSVKIRVTYGSSYKDLEISGGRTLLNNTFSYSPTPLTLSVRIMFVKYTYIENNTIEVGQINAGTHGLAEMSFTLNPLFADESEIDLIKIANKRHLLNIGNLVSSGKSFKLLNNIDLGYYSWTPLSNLTGIFYGNGCTISNFTISQSTSGSTLYSGFFQKISGVTMNLHFYNVTVTVNGSGNVYAGVVAGQLSENGAVYNSRVSGSRVTVTTSKSAIVGGLIGYVYGGKIDGGFFKGSVTATGSGSVEVGGLVGRSASGQTLKVWTSGSVTAKTTSDSTDVDCGGLIGRNILDSSLTAKYATIYDCYSTSKVTAEANSNTAYVYSGGLVGVLKESIASRCYATGDVEAKNQKGRAAAGGIAGCIEKCESQKFVTCVFAVSNVAAYGKPGGWFTNGSSLFGHFTGMESENMFSSIYYSTDATLKYNDKGVETKWSNTSWYTGKTAAELKKMAFQKALFKMGAGYWNFVDGQYPTLN